MGFGNSYGDRGGFRQNRFSPVSVGEELDVLIEASGEKGDGICKKKGFVLFVPNTKEGDKVKIRVTKVLRKVGFAEVIGDADESRIESDAQESQPMAPPEPEPVPEDTDDFGEEPEEEVEEEPEAEEEPEDEPEAEEEPEDELEEEEDLEEEPKGKKA